MGMIKFSERIKEYMETYNLSQADVAKRVGVTGQAVSSWVMGRTTPVVGRLPDLAKKLNVSVLWLLGDPNAKMLEKDNDDLATQKIEDQETMENAPKVELNGSIYPVYTEEQLDKRLAMIARAMDMFDQGKIDSKMLELIVNSMR